MQLIYSTGFDTKLNEHIKKHNKAYNSLVEKNEIPTDSGRILYITLDGCKVGAFILSDDDLINNYIQINMAIYDEYSKKGVGERALNELITTRNSISEYNGIVAVVRTENPLKDKIENLLIKIGFRHEDGGSAFIYNFIEPISTITAN